MHDEFSETVQTTAGVDLAVENQDATATVGVLASASNANASRNGTNASVGAAPGRETVYAAPTRGPAPARAGIRIAQIAPDSGTSDQKR